MIDLYLPTASIFIAPFAMLPWETAQVLWTILASEALSLRVPDVGFRSKLRAGNLLWLDLLVLANTEAFFPFGNPVGIVISLCVVAVWCFLKDRFVWAGIYALPSAWPSAS